MRISDWSSDVCSSDLCRTGKARLVSAQKISDRVHIARRYVRAIDLQRDHLDPGALEGYVLTPSARDAATRLAVGLGPKSSQRAFRVVGPYGSGKSSFGVLDRTSTRLNSSH